MLTCEFEDLPGNIRKSLCVLISGGQSGLLVSPTDWHRRIFPGPEIVMSIIHTIAISSGESHQSGPEGTLNEISLDITIFIWMGTQDITRSFNGSYEINDPHSRRQIFGPSPINRSVTSYATVVGRHSSQEAQHIQHHNPA